MPFVPDAHSLLVAVAALTDAFVEDETFANHATPEALAKYPKKAARSLIYQAKRGEVGSADWRDEIIELAKLTEEVWHSFDSDAPDGPVTDVVTWDFDFCPAAVEAYFAQGLRDDALKAYLAAWVETEAAHQGALVIRGA